MSAAILPLDKVKEILAITDTTSDAKLTAALPVVTEYFENYCKRGLAFVSGVVEELPVSLRLGLFRFPLGSAVDVLINGVAPANAPPIDAARGFVHMGLTGCYPGQVARVTYDGGYDPDAVPADLADAYAKCCADFGGVAYVSGGASSGAPLKSLGLGSGALTVAFDTSAAVQSAYDTSAVPALLAPYLFTLEHYRVKDFV